MPIRRYAKPNICTAKHHWRGPSAAQTTATQPLPCGLSEPSTWTEGDFSHICKDSCPAVAKHNIHMNPTHAAISVQPQNLGSPSCWHHLCSLAHHLLGQGEQGPPPGTKSLSWVLHVNPLSTGNLLKAVIKSQIICVYTLWAVRKHDRQTLSVRAAAYFN